MFCSKCGKSISESNSFCDGCGAPLQKKGRESKLWIFISIAVVFLAVIIVFIILSAGGENNNALNGKEALTGLYTHCQEDIKITFSGDGTCIWATSDIEFYNGTYDYVNDEYIITIYYKEVYDQQITFIYKAYKEGEYLYITGNTFDNEVFVPIN